MKQNKMKDLDERWEREATDEELARPPKPYKSVYYKFRDILNGGC